MFEKYAAELAAQQTTRPRMLRQRRDDLVLLCIRHPTLCSEARRLLKPEHYSLPGEKAHQTILRHLWKLLDSGVYQPGGVPQAALYNAVAEELVGLRPAELDQPWVGEVVNDPTQAGWEAAEPGLIYRAYHSDLAGFDNAYAFETLRFFLEERAIVDRVAALAANLGPRVPIGSAQAIRKLADEAVRIEAIGDNPFELPLPDDWAPITLTIFPTGCPWIDDLLKGQVAGDVNGLIGTYGGGKTTGLAQLVVGTARHFLAQAAETGGKPKICLLLSYEEPTDLIRPRIISCAAQVSKFRLETLPLDQLSRRGKLADYELAMYREMGQENYQELDGEYERVMQARAEINQAIRIVNMRAPGRGTGWVDELAAYIDRFCTEKDVEVGVVCLDYVNAMIRRHVDTLARVYPSTMRDLIQKTPLAVEEKIARRFNCPVWLAQQFSGEANKKAPTAKMMMADASEARSFGENLVFCVAFAPTDPATKVIQATYVKARRLGVQGDTRLFRLEGDFARITRADKFYEVVGGRIVDKRLKAYFGDTAPAHGKAAFLAPDMVGISDWEEG